jgi:hypothetical protein
MALPDWHETNPDLTPFEEEEIEEESEEEESDE